MASVQIEERKLKSGETSFKVSVKVTKRKKVIDRMSLTFDNLKSAERWAAKSKKALEQKHDAIKLGIYRRDTSLRECNIGELIQEYLDNPLTNIKLKRTKKYVLKALLNYDIASITASQLKAEDLVQHCLYRKSESHSPKPSTVYQDVAYLKSVMKVAKNTLKINASTHYHDEALETLTSAELIGRSEVRERRPSENELQLMFEHLRIRETHPQSDIPYCDILETSLLTAMRVGELTKVLWSDIDHENKTLMIRGRKDPRKSQGTNLEIPLLGNAYEIIMRQPKQSNKDTAHLIFPYNSRSITSGWRAVRKNLGIPDLRYHDLRREAASRLAEMGMPINIVAKVTGHKNLNILHNIYTAIDIKAFGREGYGKYIDKN
jgi:integrase